MIGLFARVPLQFAAMIPEMIAGNDSPKDTMFLKDRKTFIDHFSSVIGYSGLGDDIVVHLRSIIADEELQIFYSSIGSKSVYAHWVTKYCVRSTQWINAVITALDKFILAHPKTEQANLSEIRSVLVRLSEMQG